MQIVRYRRNYFGGGKVRELSRPKGSPRAKRTNEQQESYPKKKGKMNCISTIETNLEKTECAVVRMGEREAGEHIAPMKAPAADKASAAAIGRNAARSAVGGKSTAIRMARGNSGETGGPSRAEIGPSSERPGQSWASWLSAEGLRSSGAGAEEVRCIFCAS